MKNTPYKIIFIYVVALSLSLSVFSQDDAEVKEKKEEPAPSKETQEINLPGDVIIFTTGKKMVGVQVLRELPDKIEVQARDGIDPIYLPRQFIKEIIYDDIDPLREKRLKALGITTPSGEGLIPGEELSQEFNQKMRAPLSNEPIIFKDTGFPRMLTDLANRIGVKIEFDEAIKGIPIPERIKNFEIPPGTSLYKFLQTDFANAFPNISVTFKYDTIHVALKNQNQTPTNQSTQQ